jgi:hypothetical protein
MSENKQELLIRHKNILAFELNDLKTQIRKGKLAVANYKHSGLPEKYINDNIVKLELNLKTKDKKQAELEFRIKQIEKGELDEKILKNEEEISRKNNSNILVKANRKNEQIEQKKADKSRYDNIVLKDIEEKRGIKDKNYEIKQDYYRFVKISENLPEYLEANLKKMPMNKGYKFRGIIFFGELPPEENTYVVFERINKEILHIHTWNDQYEYLYEKKGKEKKNLIKKIPKKKILENRNSDYINF